MTDDSTCTPDGTDGTDKIESTDIPGSPVTTLPRTSYPATMPAVMPAVLPTATQSVTVAFAGEGAGICELTWGQREIWLSMMRQGWLRMGGVLPLAPDTSVQDVADELAYMMSRYQSLRTRFRFDESGLAAQEIFASGEIMLEVYDTDDESGPQEKATAVEAKYLTVIRDYVDEWPVRMAVVRHRGVPTHLVVITCHLVSDGAGMRVLTREVQARRQAPVEGMQLLDLACWQHSPAGERQTAVALRYTETLMRSVQPCLLRESSDRRVPRHWTGKLNSPALRLAVQVVSERTGADSASVIQALYAIVMGRRALLNPAVIRPLVSNRFRPGLADLVSNLVQSGIFVLDVAEMTVDEAIARAQRASRTAYKHSYRDPDQEQAMVERIAQDQGPKAVAWSVQTWGFFNDRRTLQSSAAQPAGGITSELVERLLADSQFSWTEKKENTAEPLFLHVEDAPESIVLVVSGDTHFVSPADTEGLAWDIEAIAVQAMFDPAVPTLVPMAARS